MAGYWDFQSSVDLQSCLEGESDYLDAWTGEVTQNGNVISILNSMGDVLPGTFNGDMVTFDGSYTARVIDDFFGMFTGAYNIDTLDLTLSMAGDTMSGSVNWTRDSAAGVSECSGTTQIFASQNSAVVESEPNNQQVNAQLLDIIVNDIGVPQLSTATFVNGSIDLASDEFDAFRLQITADSILEIELSHFDAVNDDLDLTLYDANLNFIDFGLNSSGFEYIAQDLSPGTYYILVEAFATSGPTSYRLSVDLNP
jgi:hypothetical protein